MGTFPKYRRVLARLSARLPWRKQLSRQIKKAGLSFVSQRKFRRLGEALAVAGASPRPGLYIEAGVALGGTAIYISKLKPATASLVLYDVFGMIPPPGEEDPQDSHDRFAKIAAGEAKGLGGDIYYGYRDDLEEAVKASLEKFGIDLERDHVSLVRGLFEDTLVLEKPVRFAHIDADWYSSVTTCISRIWPWLVEGGVMVFDDYHSYEGCKRAVDEFVTAQGDKVEVLFTDSSFALRRVR